MDKVKNVTWQQWNLLDAARAHLSEVCAAKAALEAEREEVPVPWNPDLLILYGAARDLLPLPRDTYSHTHTCAAKGQG